MTKISLIIFKKIKKIGDTGHCCGSSPFFFFISIFSKKFISVSIILLIILLNRLYLLVATKEFSFCP